jgi:hypothetical protein
VKRFLQYQPPFFKGDTIPQKEPGQQTAAIQGHGLTQPRHANRAGFGVCVGMPAARFDQFPEAGAIKLKIAARIKVDILAGD